jgi:hypothetical protein
MDQRTALAEIYRWLKRVQDSIAGPPPRHGISHDVDLTTGGTDPLSYGMPGELADETEMGDGPGPTLAGHTHKRQIEVEENGTPVGIRRKLNFIGAVVTDDPGGDEVDVTIDDSEAAAARYLAWVL